MTDQDELSTEEFIDQFREPTEKELKAYDKIYPRGLRQEREWREIIFFSVGILVGGLLMRACWLVASVG